MTLVELLTAGGLVLGVICGLVLSLICNYGIVGVVLCSVVCAVVGMILGAMLLRPLMWLVKRDERKRSEERESRKKK